MGTVIAILVAFGVFFVLVKKVNAESVTQFPKERTNSVTKSVSDIVAENSARFGIPIAWINAHIQVESSGDINARNPSDPSFGLMGITPILAQTYGYINDYRNFTALDIEKIMNPENNIAIGTRFLSHLHSRYDFDTATQMYNCGESGFKNGIRVPEYLSKIKRQLGM